MERLEAYLRGLRDKQKLSWADISERANLPESTCRKIITGGTEDPRFSTVIRLTLAMGGSVNDLMAAMDGAEPKLHGPDEQMLCADPEALNDMPDMEGIEVQSFAPMAPINIPAPKTISDDTMELIEQLRAVYVEYIKDIKEQHQEHVKDLEKANDEQYKRLSHAAGRHIFSLRVTCIALAAVILLYFIIDLCVGTRGWILY